MAENIVPLRKSETLLNTKEVGNHDGDYMWFGEDGACPECGSEGNNLYIGSVQFFYCNEHKVYWYFLYDPQELLKGKGDPEAIQNAGFILEYTQVAPLRPMDLIIMFLKDRDKESVIGQIEVQLEFLKKNWHRLGR
jgi:hypothetical protein